MKNDDDLDIKKIEVKVYDSFDDAYRKFKTLVQADGVLALYRAKQSYEKPSERKRRKEREAENRRFLAEMRENLIISGEWEKRQKKKETKRLKKQEERLNKQQKEE